MPWSKTLSRHPQLWFRLGLVGLLFFSLALRFWGLSRFNTFVFDEVYFAKFANNYLTNTPFFDGHPPLAKYLIAIGIWLANQTPWGTEGVKNALTGSLLTPFSYRWLNAFTGAWIPLVVAAIAYQLSRRRSYALIAGLFSALDGLFLVESRYALVNVYLVLFGLLGQWFFLRSLDRAGWQRWLWLILAGVGFGASAAVKWNGLWFLFGAYLLWGVTWALKLGPRLLRDRPPVGQRLVTPLQKLTQVNLLAPLIMGLAIVPVLVYSVSWIPHLQLNPTPDFWQVQERILRYHENVGNGAKVHPYCSNWYTWIWMQRPVVYFYETALSPNDPVPMKPALPSGTGKLIYDVHAMGNPALWWLSSVAIAIVIWMLLDRCLDWVNRSSSDAPAEEVMERSPYHAVDIWIGTYLLVNYVANILPWMKVTRCTFLYHYMGASVFSLLAIAWLVDRWLHSRRYWFRIAGVTVIFLVILAFVFWLPLYLGLPLSPGAAQLRRWLPTW
jgi:dolichyl-phosphate-mannose--protein O-mannosyl transferase